VAQPAARHRAGHGHRRAGPAAPSLVLAAPCGGQTLWVRLPGVDAPAFAQTALRHGVAVVPEPLLSPDPRGGDHLSIPFVAPPDQLVRAVDRLADAWTAHRRSRP
jgi:DNA-binding transcriptional MocR family regulator